MASAAVVVVANLAR